MTRVLIVEDDPGIRATLLFQLRDWGMAPRAEENAEAALARLESRQRPLPDLLLLDVRLPGINGVELVRRLVAAGRLPPTIVISGEASITETVEALQLGVHDFIEKPFSKERLRRSIRNTLEHCSLQQQVAALETELGERHEILGSSAPIAALRSLIAQAAPTDGRVLIRGESGTGKELVADALHRGSRRRDAPFIKINCAAIPAALVEDELFGHVQGAFTDARSNKPGLFEEADGGTLFLDEIGDMELALQARLLRVLEDGLVRRIGESTDRRVDVRVLAATHANLEQGVREGRFRQDLYFRLAHLPIVVPPLRQRSGDVRLLFDHFIDRAWRRHRMRPRQVDETVYAILESHPWPGNVRELVSLCERLVVFGADPITAGQVREGLSEGIEVAPQGGGTGPEELLPLREFKARAEERHIRRALARTGWNVAEAARQLGLQRTYLHQKMAALGITRPS
jgi:DNA-binding NtrC family response regulator